MLNINDSITDLHGIGPKSAQSLEKLKIRTIEDFLSYYPKAYQDRGNRKKIAHLSDGETALITGRISLIVKGGYGYGRKKTLRLLVTDESGGIELVFFNAAYLEKTINKEQEYEFFGKVLFRGGRLQMAHPEIKPADGPYNEEILPIYLLTRGITQNNMRKWQRQAQIYTKEIQDYLPAEIRERNRLCSLQYAIENIHFPKAMRKAKEAGFRLVFDELFLLQLGLLSIKNKINNVDKSIAFSTKAKTGEFVSSLPFSLTKAQIRVLGEIEEDMESDRVMNRLVQGDVGSGKTVIAAAAAYKAVKSGYQAVMMAPTELLARQHYAGLSRLFAAFGVKVGLLTGSMKPDEREAIRKKLAEGEIDFIVGTHALIQADVKYSNLGLVITDEQHRFGVNQRNLLSLKGENPDILVMTATPIPRTLAVILYGDLDHSAIDEMPLGRKPIKTKVVEEKDRDKAYDFLKNQVENGRQGYIVAPLIEDSEHLDVKSATNLFEEITSRFKKFKVRLLHGSMKQQEKDLIMEDFYSGSVDILVSTVVIEVGIDVPNATVMIVENAERFGLATLHQLRGRVGRGEHKSNCFLIIDSKNQLANERVGVMEETNDGFLIAEKDLTLRGPGEFFGVKQHGLPELKIADLSKHLRILDTVRKEAVDLLQRDPLLIQKENHGIKNELEKLFDFKDIINI